MKTLIPLKSFNASSSGAVKITDANAPGIPESSPQQTSESVPDFHAQQNGSGETFRAMLDRRYNAPYVSAISHHRWGLNE